MWRVSLAIDAERAPLDPRQRGHHLRREALAQEGDRALVGERLDDRRDRVGAPRALRDQLAQRASGRAPAPGAVAPWK